MASRRSTTVPGRMSEAWLEENCPKLTVTQARDLVAALRAKGWTDRKGSLADRVYARFSAKVRDSLAAERKAAK